MPNLNSQENDCQSPKFRQIQLPQFAQFLLSLDTSEYFTDDSVQVRTEIETGHSPHLAG
jgi:hypothetical protein